MENKRLFDIVSTILALSKKKKKEFYDYLTNIDERLKNIEDKCKECNNYLTNIDERLKKVEDKCKEAREVPLTFEITSDGNIVWKATDTEFTKTIEYKKNDGEWTSITSNISTTNGTSSPSGPSLPGHSTPPTNVISVVSGDIVQFRGDNATYATSEYIYNCFDGTTCGFKVKGNIMSLINSVDFANLDTLESAYTFNKLFYNCTGLTDANELVLPATTLTNSCYASMFRSCTSLITTPELPATILAISCYASMFDGCSSLTIAPSLPATTLANYCYFAMFCNCSSLTTVPSILPATTLAEGCYREMFVNCTSLTTAPELPATSTITECYFEMFRNCSSLNHIKCLATDISTGWELPTNGWVNGVSATGTFVKNALATGWQTGYAGIPTNWTVQDA